MLFWNAKKDVTTVKKACVLIAKGVLRDYFQEKIQSQVLLFALVNSEMA